MALASLLPSFAAPTSQAPKDEWILTQQHPDYGKVLVYISPNAVKVTCIKRGFEVLCSSPDWLIHSFRRQEKLMFTTQLSNFSSIAMVNPFGDSKLKERHLKPSSKGSLDGLKYTIYDQGEYRNQHIVWGADEIVADRHVAEFLCRYYYLPHIDKVPLYEASEHVIDAVRPKPLQAVRKSDHPWFDTNDFVEKSAPSSGLKIKVRTMAWKKVPFNASDFELPTGYTVAKDAKQILVSVNQKKELEEMFDSIGFTSDVLRKESKASPDSKPDKR